MISKEYVKYFFLKVIFSLSVLLHSPEGLSVQPNLKKKSLAGSQFLEGGYWKRGVDLFEQGEGGITVVT